MKKICPNCDSSFETDNKLQKYCTKKCYSSSKSKRHYKKHGSRGARHQKVCKFCKKEFRGKKSRKFCSSKCASDSRKLILDIPQALAEGHRKIDKNIGYVRVYCPVHPKANTWGYVYEHRLVMEEILGRYLKQDEHVHHKDGKRWNNIPSNLEVLSPSEHGKITAENRARSITDNAQDF